MQRERRAKKSYSIIDHQLLHGGYFHRLSHKGLSLYLFFVVVGDREGKSYYGDKKITEILNLTFEELELARAELKTNKLITVRGTYTFVENIEGNHYEQQNQRADKSPDQVHERHRESELSPNRGKSWHVAGEVLSTILRESQKYAAGKKEP